MGIKISELPLGTAEVNAVVPATNAAGNLTEKVTLGDIANLRKDWEVAVFSDNSFTAAVGRKYIIPPMESNSIGGLDVLDPSSPENGDWYFLWDQSANLVRVAGEPISSNQILARRYSSLSERWTTQTISSDLSFLALVATSGSASDLVSGTLPDERLSANIARISDVSAAVSDLVDSAPETLSTLNSLAAALGEDANFATTITNELASKAPINNPTFTGVVGGITKNMVGLGNVPDVDATNRANHTGTQLASTISDFNTVVSNAVSNSFSTSIVAGTNVSLNYNLASDTLTIGLSSSLAGMVIDGGTP